MAQLRYVLLAVTLVVLVGVSAVAVNVPNAFVAGEVIRASEMNANFAALEAAVAALEVSAAALEAAQPVVAHAQVEFSVGFAGETTEAVDLVTVEIEVPAAGVVVVEAAAQTLYFGTTAANQAVLAIDATEGGAIPFAAASWFGADAPANTGGVYGHAALRRAFTVPAGVHTFRLEGFDESGNGQKSVYNPSITATWYPEGRATVAGVSGASAR